MLRSNPRLGPLLAFVGDHVAIAASAVAAMALMGVRIPPMAALPISLLHAFVAADAGLYGQLRYLGGLQLLKKAFAVWFRVALVVLAIALFVPEPFPRLAAVWFVAFYLAAFASVRLLTRAVRRFVRQRGRNLRYLVVAGTGPDAARAAQEFSADPGLGMRLVGFLGESQGFTLPAPLLGAFTDLETLVRSHVIDEVLVAAPDASVAQTSAIVETCNLLGLRTHLYGGLLPGTWRNVDARQHGDEVVLSLTPYPHGAASLVMKRALDIAISAFALLAMAPLLLLIAALVKLTSKGPVFFVQWRIGLNGRRFRFPKFRSMVQDAEARLAEVMQHNEMDGPVFKMKRDPRITRLGAFLRRYSLDELPQLWCVLKGDMSLVGPRPLMPHEIDGHASWQRRRLSMRPGLTCLWQIGGRNAVDFDRWMRLDLQYIDSWSLGLDMRILLRTVPAVLSGRGAS
jgi:exopolysaccharide biosynthesis polyprenyl glycosylphosphotransferase